MRKIYSSTLLFLFLLFCSQAFGQAVTTVPAFPTADKEVTIIFDVTKAKDTRAAGLLGKSDDVYLWSGAGTTESGNAFEYQPTGQTDFSKPFQPGKMTSLGNNKWQIKLVPRQYFGVPAGKPIKKLGVLLKSGNGSAQTEDFFITIYDDKLSASFKSPTQKAFFVDANTSISVEAVASAAATLTLKKNNTVLVTEESKDKIIYTLNAGTQRGVRNTVVFEAKTSTETATDTFYYTIKPQPVTAALPAGIKDGVNYTSATSATLSFFAPHKEFVYAIGEFNNWQATEEYLMKRSPDGTRYWIELTGLEPGKEIAYQYLVDGTLAVADPYTHKILDPWNDKYLTDANYPNLKPFPKGANGIVSVMQTNQPTYTWEVPNFKRPDPKNLVVYELLVRDFVATRNYKTLIDTLSYIKRLGVNAIELMPVMEFAGNDSWGYNPIFYFAPDKAYGTAKELKMFIDACHKNGIAVILDIVLNQADYEFPYVKMYWDGNKPSANSPYFNQQATHPFSVFFDFNHDAEPTKELVRRVTKFWLQEYNVDGFRFDLSKGFTQKNTGNDVGAWSSYDASRVATWKRIYNEIRSYDQTAYIILEHFADNSEEKELADYGMLFWGNSSWDYRKAAKGEAVNFDWISYKRRGWQNPYLMGYIESHDEERVVYDVKEYGLSSGAYNTRNLVTTLNRAKLAAAFSLTVPGPKLMWQFGELGYDFSIDYNGRTGAKPIKWDYQKDSERQKLYKVYAELIKLKTTQPVFQTNDYALFFDGMVKRMVLNDASNSVFIIGNFDVRQRVEEAKFPSAGKWFDHFTGEAIQVNNPLEQIVLQPGEFRVFTTVALKTPEAGLLPWQSVALSAADEMAAASSLVYPNPFKGNTQLEINNKYRGNIDLKLMDITGRVIRTEQVYKDQELLLQNLEMNKLVPGLYMLQVKIGEGTTVKRILKTN